MIMVDRLKKRGFLVFLFALLILLMTAGYPYAQKQSAALTILYTNNISGEIDPCPT
jgi:hypothetical protein